MKNNEAMDMQGKLTIQMIDRGKQTIQRWKVSNDIVPGWARPCSKTVSRDQYPLQFLIWQSVLAALLLTLKMTLA